ncbi:phospholipid carrier-dependent glycosyltransferase [Desulfosarcina cetonica]|uniref:phospholipid carrier-dependent glycosyltransferase n=1 Tax=Desulfosarcina cetonica TaxID=90730 RepID=UPI0006D1318B|nr:phospholipid carrier-dependent glycosyltransferase [Desulfosarcina cetonica]
MNVAQYTGRLPDGGRNANRVLALLGVLYLLVYILPLSHRPLLLPDETRYFEIPREMIATGDWVVPRLDGLVYFEKPVMGYWANALAMLVVGQNAFAVRLPGAMAMGVVALALFFGFRRTGDEEPPAWLAPLIFLTSAETFAIGTFGVLDSLFSMFLTLAMFAFFQGYQTRRGGHRRGWLLLAGALIGAAFLTKGFIAFVVPGLILAAFAFWEGRLATLLRTSWLPVLSALAVILPWGVAIYRREGDFWPYFIWVEHIQRFLHPGRGQHPEAFWFFVPVFVAGMLPWSVVAPAAVLGLRNRWGDSRIRFLTCWLIGTFLFFSASSGKLVTYILPCFPPAAALMAMGLWRYQGQGGWRAFRRGTGIWGGVLILVAVGLAVDQLTGMLGARPYGPQEAWKWALACAGLVVWGGGSLWSRHASGSSRKLVGFALAGVLFFSLAAFIFPESIYARKAPGLLLARHRQQIPDDA